MISQIPRVFQVDRVNTLNHARKLKSSRLYSINVTSKIYKQIASILSSLSDSSQI